MKPILGSLGANTLVILTPEESRLIRQALDLACIRLEGEQPLAANPAAVFNAGIARGTAHLQAEFNARPKGNGK